MANWIKRAIHKKGALTATAKRLGIVKGPDDTLSDADLDKLAAHADAVGDSTLKHRVNLARTLGAMHRK